MKAKDQRIFLEALDELEKEKGIKKEELLEAVETALLAAYKKNYVNSGSQNVRVNIDRETGEIKVFSLRRIVEEVMDPQDEISLEEAKEIDPRYELLLLFS